MSSIETSIAAIRQAAVVPVVTINDAEKAVDLARAIMAGGVNAIEVTLRTPCAVEAIRQIAAADLGILVGAGSVTSVSDIDRVLESGAEFIVTPATPAALVPALKASGKLVLPGASTPTEALSLHLEGFDIIKIFPAEQLGGQKFIAALQAPMAELKVMPSGGITPANAAGYLALPNVVAVGASWLAPADAQDSSDWASITAIVSAARAGVIA